MKIIRFVARKKWLMIALSLLLVVAAIGGVTLGKYLQVYKSSKVANSKPFYFSCNYDDGGTYYLPAHTTVVQLFNHDGIPNGSGGYEHISDEDIYYDLTIKKLNVDPAQETTTKNHKLTGGSVAQSAADSAHTISGTPGEQYQVTITTTAPYVKTISFTLILMEEDATSYYSVIVSPSGNWLQLDIYIGMEKPDSITVNYGALAPDNTNAFLTDWKTADASGVLDGAELSDHAHYTLFFFGNVDASWTVEKSEFTNLITLQSSGG